MAITKVWIEEGCTACGMCEDTCPEVFKVKDEATIIEGVDYAKYEKKIKEAADNCPVDVIKFSE